MKKSQSQSVVTIIKTLANEFDLLSRYFYEVKVYLFGSQLLHIYPSSDLDLMLVSPSFNGVNSLKRVELVARILHNPHFKIDPICLTPIEYERLKEFPSQFSQTILNNYVQIFPTEYQNE